MAGEPSFAIEIEDPLGIGTIDGTSAINVANVSGGPKSDFHETMAGNGQYIAAAVKALKPVEEWTIDYELLDGAAFEIAFGVLVNSSYVVTSAQASTSAESRPTVSVTVLKPSAASKLKAYANAVTLEMAGGFGIVEKFGLTSVGAFVSTQASVAMQNAESMEETSGDYLTGGLYYFGFKQEVTAEAYGVITGTGYNLTEQPIRRSKEGWRIYAASGWKYLDAIVAAP